MSVDIVLLRVVGAHHEDIRWWWEHANGYDREFAQWLIDQPDTVYRDNNDPEEILQRPNLDAARRWANGISEGNCEQFLRAFDLMESDPEVWFYASY